MIRKSFLIVICNVLFASFLSSQNITTSESATGKIKDLFIKADNDYAFGKLWQADSLLTEIVKLKDNFIDAWILKGHINLEYLKNYKAAEDAYQKVKTLKLDYLKEVNLYLARSQINAGKYSEAKSNLNDFLTLTRIAADQHFAAKKMLSDCDFAQEALKNPTPFKPVNLGDAVNTPEDESMPSLTADGRYLYFTRHTGLGRFQDEDIYMSLRTSAGFTPAISISDKINTERFIEGAQSISPSGKYLFFTSADRPDGVGRADIYISRKTGDLWEAPNNLGAPINTPGYETQPCISADGRALYFSSVRATGKGGSDIWVSYLDDKTGWSQPENLGDKINTQFDEMRPYIHPDGSTLYFSSNGHPGMGNFDIYMSKKQADGTWGAPVNLGYPINTSGDEIGIYVTADGTMAYYASEQEDSKGQMDIYSFEMPGNIRPGFTSYVRGNVYDRETKESIYAFVQIYDLESGKLFASLSTDKVNGVFLTTLPAGKDYGVEVMKDGYLFYSHNISLRDQTEGSPFELNIDLQKIKVGEKVVLNNIFFESESYKLKEVSNSELDVITKMMTQNPTMKIEIGGHTDNTGTESQNKLLSENRAKTVYAALVSKGVPADRITYKGYSSSKPIADNNSESGKAKNRRTEFIVTEI